jgi:exopolysaccharide biosynthesis polyprenyl glycosylphosphotransferase
MKDITAATVGAASASPLGINPPDSRIEQALRQAFGRLITLAQVIADFITVTVSYLASYGIYTSILSRTSPQSFTEFSGFAGLAGILYIVILDRVGLYRREISLLNVKELRGIFRAGIYAAAAILSVSFYIRSLDLSRITLTIAILITPVLLYLQRQIFYKIHILFHQRGWSQKRVLIYGAGSIGIHLAKRMFESPTLGLFPVGFLDDENTKQGQTIRWQGIGPKSGLPVLGGESMMENLKDSKIDSVFIALPSARFERNQRLVELCVEQGMDYAVVPNSYEKFIQHVEMFEIGGIPVLRRRVNQSSVYYVGAKRAIDFCLATLFILMLSPLYLLLGALIKLDSKGPIIFKQKRVGLNGKQFSMYKFRSMFVEAPKYAKTPADPNDPRITQVGRWLRRTSLDELPQLFNVWRGDMSLVGPRPEMPFIVDTYTPLQRQRLLAKPGITGVWQISAVRGEPIHQNIEYDLFYLENRSILLDLAIIIKTVLSVIRGVGAF